MSVLAIVPSALVGLGPLLPRELSRLPMRARGFPGELDAASDSGAFGVGVPGLERLSRVAVVSV